MTKKLNEILVTEPCIEAALRRALGEAKHTFQDPNRLSGYERTDSGEGPAETTRTVSESVESKLETIWKTTEEHLNIIGQKAIGNTLARADLEVDGEVILEDVPVILLAGLEYRLKELKKALTRVPILDNHIEWEKTDEGVYQAKFWEKRLKFKKTDDDKKEVVGEYRVRKQSGKMPRGDKQVIIERLDRLIVAAKIAVQRANDQDVEDIEYGSKIVDYIKKS